MTLPKTGRTAKSYAVGSLSGRQVVADFSGAQMTTDCGVILIAPVDAH
jgi:hypothetical protein